MPSDLYGFSGNEVVSYVQNWIGNQDSDFQSLVQQTLPLAEFRFCKVHDWSFLHKQNLSLTVASGTNEYALSVANLGYYMAASDVESVFSTANNRYLQKKTLDEIRRMDPNVGDGTSASAALAWAPVGDNTIVIYPPNFSDTTLKIDGKVKPSALSTLTNYPTIPYHRQDSFIQYVLALCLARENDDRANSMKAEAMELIKQDIQDDMRNLADSEDARIKHAAEAVSALVEFDPLNML